MHDDGQRVDPVGIDQDVQFHQWCALEMAEFIVEGSVPAAHRLQPVKEVEHDFGHGQRVLQRHLGAQEEHLLLHAALVIAQLQHCPHVVRRDQDVGENDRLAQVIDFIGWRQFRRVVDIHQRAVGAGHLVDHGGRAGDQFELVLALQAFLHDVHVQQAEKTDAEAEPQGAGDFRFVVQRRVIQLQFRQRIAEGFVVLGVDRKEAGEHPRFDLLEARQCLGRLAVFQGDGVAHGGPIDLLDAGDDETHLPGRQFLEHHRLGHEAPELVSRVTAARGHDAEFVAQLEGAVHHPHQRHHAHVVVEPGVHDQ